MRGLPAGREDVCPRWLAVYTWQLLSIEKRLESTHKLVVIDDPEWVGDP